MSSPRIDAHQHFWRYTPEDYAWITPELDVLRRDFLPGDLEPLLRSRGFDACVAVQARQDVAETRWLLELAAQDPWIAGVVGWVDLRAADVERELADLSADPRLVGIRHVVQDEPDDRFLDGPEFRRGVGALARFGLAYDLLVYPRQLPAAIDFVAALPDQPIVLDHLAKPEAREGRFEPWAGRLAELARAEHVSVKLSGLVTEADWQSWSPEALRRYLDHTLECFGPDRVLFGSDWPVCLLAASYARVAELIEDFARELSEHERAALFGGNAARIYGLPPHLSS
jgi:L-fuconolactonase